MSNFKFSLIEEFQHQNICDASASIPLGQDHFVVGNDEDNILRVYSAQESGEPINEGIDINDYFTNNPKKKEIDIEAVTESDGIIYWITSHGRNKKDERKLERHQFFANKITNTNPLTFELKQQGESYTELLLKDMLADDKLSSLNLKTAETIAPKKEGGLNIEGLTTTPEGEILIGFRNPITLDGKAILIPLKNPRDLINLDETVKAEFREPILLDLGGLGIRSIEYWSTINGYLIIAGHFGSKGEFALYIWSGNKLDKPDLIDFTFPKDFRPESILVYPHLNNRFQIFSDDGSVIRGGQECKKMSNDNPEKYFRSIWIKVGEI